MSNSREAFRLISVPSATVLDTLRGLTEVQILRGSTMPKEVVRNYTVEVRDGRKINLKNVTSINVEGESLKIFGPSDPNSGHYPAPFLIVNHAMWTMYYPEAMTSEPIPPAEPPVVGSFDITDPGPQQS